MRRWLVAAMLSALLVIPQPDFVAEEGLVLGVFPRRNVKQTVSGFTPLAGYLAKQLHRPVRVETAVDFESFWDTLSKGHYDIVHYNQYHYLRSHKTLGYQVIAMNEEFGRTRVTATVTVRRDGGISNVLELKGKQIVFGGGPHAMLNYIVPRYLLAQAGLEPGDYQTSIAKHPCNSVIAVCVEQADAAATNDIALDMQQTTDSCDTSRLMHLLKSKPMAHLPWAVKGDMAETLHNRIRHLLLETKHTAEGRAALASANLTGLLPAADKDYDPYREIVRVTLNETY